jgi:AcrR family transcriptional regulator
LIAGGNLVPAFHVREATGGRLRPVHDIGLPLIAVPYVRVAAPLTSWIAEHVPERLMRAARLTPTTLYRHVISLAMISGAALLALSMFDAVMRLGASHRAAFATTLLLIASPPLLVYSILFFTELLSALLAFFAFVTLMWRRDDRLLVLAAGIATGFLLLVHIRNVGMVVGLIVAATMVLRGEARRNAPAFFLGLILMAGVRTAINHYLWSTWITTPHAAAGSWEGVLPTVTIAGMRLVALLVDQEYGLLIYGPVYLVAAMGVPLFVRRAPHLAWPLVAVVVCYVVPMLLPISNPHGWSGQWCPAGRFLTPMLPLLVLPLWFAMHALPPSVVTIVVALQIFLSAWFWQNPKLLWNDGDGRAAFCSQTGQRVCASLPAFARSVR